MSETLRTQVRNFLDQLEAVQEELLELFVLKRTALITGDLATISSLQTREIDGSKRLQGLLNVRNRILNEAGRQIPVKTLSELADFCVARPPQEDATAWEEIQGLIGEAQERTARMRHESWVHWIVSHRCYNHYTEVLDLIAQGGVPSPTYGNQSRPVTGGTLLDASI